MARVGGQWAHVKHELHPPGPPQRLQLLHQHLPPSHGPRLPDRSLHRLGRHCRHITQALLEASRTADQDATDQNATAHDAAGWANAATGGAPSALAHPRSCSSTGRASVAQAGRLVPPSELPVRSIILRGVTPGRDLRGVLQLIRLVAFYADARPTGGMRAVRPSGLRRP